MTDNNNIKRCGLCDEPHGDLQEGIDGEMLCPSCIIKESRRYAIEGERGQGQRTIGEERAVKRGEGYGSGWPR